MYRKILVPLDGSVLAECVLRPVGDLVRGCEVENVIFLCVVEPLTAAYENAALSPRELDLIETMRRDNAQKYLNDVVSRVRYAVLTGVVLGAAAAEGIIDYARDNGVDLIVMATHGRSGVSRWVWGSVADRVLKAAHVPVFMLRAPGCFPGI